MSRTIDDYIFEIEDYIGGNIEGVEKVDQMGLTVFLRKILTEVTDSSERTPDLARTSPSDSLSRMEKE